MVRLLLSNGAMEHISDDEIDGLTEKIIGCAMTVHTELGPGLLESIYRDALAIELELARLRLKQNDESRSTEVDR